MEASADEIQFSEPREEEEAQDALEEQNELMILRAAWHVKSARAQRSLYQVKTKSAEESTLKCAPHSEAVYTLVVDYGQNMEMPAFNSAQPGKTYYFSPLSVYNLGCVNVAHKTESGVEEHMYAHVYHSGTAYKGGNSVASLLMKTLRSIGILRDGEMGKELNVVFDNCAGQNKNNMVLRLVPFLVEMGFFARVNFIFLVVGHTKNSADRLFNALKEVYRGSNIGTMEKLYPILNSSKKVTVVPAQSQDFFDYDAFFDLFYRELTGLVKKNHIFSCDKTNCWEGTKLLMDIRQCDLPDASHVRYNILKQRFHRRKEIPKYHEAVLARKTFMADYLASGLTNLPIPGIPPYTQVQLHEKFGPCLDPADAEVTCPKPSSKIYELVKREGSDRKKMKLDLIERKREAKIELDNVADCALKTEESCLGGELV